MPGQEQQRHHQFRLLHSNCPPNARSDPPHHISDISEDLVTNTEVHTDLDPGESPDWSVEVSLVDKPECLLAKHLDKHLALCSDSRTVRMLIEELLEESEGDAGMGQVLDLLVLTSYSLADLSGLVRPLRRSPTGGLKN